MRRHAGSLRSQRTRRQIMDAACQLMIRQGYAATSMRQIAGRAHLALGGIYNHFSSKSEVFGAILQDRHPFREILPILGSVEGDSAEAYVRNAARTLVTELGRHPDFLKLMLIDAVEFKAAHIRSLLKDASPLVLPVADRLTQLDGKLRSGPRLTYARGFLGMIFTYYLTDTLLPDREASQRQAQTLEHYVDIFLHGILVEEAM